MPKDDLLIIERADGGVSVVHIAPKFIEATVHPAEYDKITGELIVPEVTEEDAWQMAADDALAKLKDAGERADPFDPDSEFIPYGAPVSHQRVAKANAQIPNSRVFRNAWKIKPGGCEVDMAKALPIAQDKIRIARAKKWPDLDGEINDAALSGQQAKIDAENIKRNKLKDSPADSRLTGARSDIELEAAMNAVIAEINAL